MNKYKTDKELSDLGYEPAYLNSNDENLEDGKYCRFCGMIWYNCLCSHNN